MFLPLLLWLLQNVPETSPKPVPQTQTDLANSTNFTENESQDATKNNGSTIKEPIIEADKVSEVNRVKENANDDKKDNIADSKSNKEVVGNNKKTIKPETSFSDNSFKITSTSTEAMLVESDNLTEKEVKTTNIPLELESNNIVPATNNSDEVKSDLNIDDLTYGLRSDNVVENVSKSNDELQGEDGLSNSSSTIEIGEVEVTSNNSQMKSSLDNVTEEDFKDVSYLDDTNPNEEADLTKTIKALKDLKDEIKEQEDNINDLLESVGGGKETSQIEDLLEEIDGNNSKLKILKQQIADSNYPLDNETIFYIETVIADAVSFLQSSRDRLREVQNLEYLWDSTKKPMFEGVTNTVLSVDDRAAETKSYEELLKQRITSGHLKAHEEGVNDEIEDVIDKKSSIQKFLVSGLAFLMGPGLGLLVFLLIGLSVVIYKINIKIKSTGLESKSMDGYTQLEVKIDDNNYDPADGGRRYQKFK